MKRKMIGALAFALSCSAAVSTVDVAYAAPKKKAAKTEQREAPMSAAISAAMGDLEWGMSRDDVMAKFVDAIKEKYRPLIAKATGALEEDKYRAKAREELSMIKSSLVEFNGNKTGWDVSFLANEFTHHNGESMFVVKDGNSQNYYFFINNKLWKWYKAFSSEVFQGKSFDQFAQAVQGRYGQGQLREAEKQKFLQWQDASTSLRAVDNNQFYGFYCLVFEDKDTLRRIDSLRSVKPSQKQKGHILVEAVTADDSTTDPSANPDIIDRITGKIRNKQQAPEQAAQASSTGKKGASAAPAPAASPFDRGGVSDDDDPLKGLGI